MSEDASANAWQAYPRDVLLWDFARAGGGAAVCLLALLIADILPWLAWLFLAGLALFAVFALRTALRWKTRYRLTENGVEAAGPFARGLAWDDLTKVKLRYYSTKRNRQGGWFVLTLKGKGRALSLEFSLPEFVSFSQQAVRAAGAKGLKLDGATADNLAALGIRAL